jgi:hypothetical protein
MAGYSYVTPSGRHYSGVRSRIDAGLMCANGDQLGFSSGGSGESGPRSSTSATGSSKASTIWVSAATAVCGLTCLTFDRVAFFAPIFQEMQ